VPIRWEQERESLAASVPDEFSALFIDSSRKRLVAQMLNDANRSLRSVGMQSKHSAKFSQTLLGLDAEFAECPITN
jgi:hypothetical protein